MRILIADDEQHVTDGLQRMINWGELGITDIQVASNGLVAWELYKKERPDLVLSDVAMAKMSGLQLARKIREDDTEIPIVLLSGYSEFEFAREAVSLQVARYILKPTVFHEIQEVLREVVAELMSRRRTEWDTRQFIAHVEQNMPQLRERFLADLVVNSQGSLEMIQKQLQFYRLDERLLSGGLVLCLKLYRNAGERTYLEQDWQLFKYSVKNIVQELAGQVSERSRYPIYILPYVEDRLPLLCIGDAAEETVARGMELAHLIMDKVNRFLDLDANIGIGHWRPHAAEYFLSHREAVQVLQYLEYEGYQRVLRFGELVDRPSEWNRDYPRELVQQTGEHIAQGRYEEAWQLWGDIEQRLTAEEVTVGHAQIMAILVLGQLQLEYGDLSDSSPLSLHMVQEVLKTHSRKQIGDYMKACLEQLIVTHRQQLYERVYANHVQRLIAHIEKHYHENVSFSKLAKEMYMTRNYLSKLFKKETGISFVTYLNNYRIERAKELLKRKQLMVYEISDQVGYSDPAYFSRVFKQATGMSPLEYMHV